MKNHYSTEKTPYIYYYKSWGISDDKKEGQPIIYMLDTRSEKIKSIDIGLNEIHQFLDYLSIDENGNLLITMRNGKLGIPLNAF